MPVGSRVVIIVNPIAGGGRGPRVALDVERRLAAEGRAVERVETRAAGDAERLAREAVASRARVVLVCGGDGTVNEAVQALAGTDTALAVMPLGTANVLARELGVFDGARAVAGLILRGRRRRFDLGRANGRYFICMASVGFDAFVTERMARERRGSISYMTYFAPTWRAFRDYPFAPLRITVDGTPLERPAYHVIVGNVRGYGGPFSVTPAAKPDDGRLDACVFRGCGRGWLLFHMAAMAAHVHHRFGSVEVVRGSRIEVASDAPVPLQLDGDFKGHAPVVFEVVPNAVTVLRNRG